MKDGGDVSFDSESWNIGADYVQHCILVPIVRCNRFIRTALRGTEEIEDAVVLHPDIKALYRKEALERLYDELQLIVSNSDFKILKNDQSKLKAFEKDLENAAKEFDNCFSVKENTMKGTKEIDINDKPFKKSLNILRKVHREILFLLDRSNLIFKKSESIDLDKLKKQIKYGG